MLLERQLSSAGCSTSYDSELYLEIVPRLVNRRRRPNLRCAAQQPAHRASSKPERDVNHTFSQPHRAWSPVAARAVTISPASPPRDGLRYLPTDLASNIPDTLPRIEELEDLRSRALHLTSTPSGWADQTPAPCNDLATSSAPGPLPYPTPQQLSSGANHSSFPGARTKPPSLGGPPPQPPPLSDWHVPLQQPHPQTYSLPPRGSSFRRSRPSTAGPSVVQLTAAIKAVRHWQDMAPLLNGLGGAAGGRGDVSGSDAVPLQCSLDAFNAAVFLTHLAQLVANSPQLGPEELQELERMQDAVLQVVGANIHEYRARQVANMSWALARLGLPSGAAFLQDHLLPAAYPLLRWYEPQHLSNTLWALATAGLSVEDFWLREALTVAGRGLRRWEFTSPQHVATLLWALERLGVVPDQDWLSAYATCSMSLLPKANGQDCSNMLASLALMGMHQTSPQTTTALATRIAERLQQLLLTSNPVAASEEGPSKTAASALAMTPMPTQPHRGAVANTLSTTDPAPFTYTTIGSSTTTASDGDAVSDLALANSLWALSAMDLQPQAGLWEAVCTVLRIRLADPSRPAPGMAPSVLSLALWAAGSLGRALPGEVMRAVYGRLRERQMECMEPRSLATLVWTVATAQPEQARPPAQWVAEVVAVTERSMAQLGPQSVSNLLYGLQQLGVRPPAAWMTALINHFHRNVADRASGQSLSNVLWCLAKMGYRLNAEGLTALTGPLTARLQTWQQQGQQQQQRGASTTPFPPPFNSQELSNMMYALAVMGHQPAPGGELVGGLMAATWARLGEARPQELSNMMWSLAVMQVRPSDAWLADFCAAAHSALPSFTILDLAQTLYGAAKLRLPLQLPSPSTTSLSTSPVSSFTAAALTATPDLLPSAGGQELCNLSWAIVRLGLPMPPDSRLAAAFTARLVTLAGRAGGSGGSRARGSVVNGGDGKTRDAEAALLALGVWALGKWRVLPAAGQLSLLERSSFRAMPAMRPHELAALLSGFAGMGHTPPSEWLEEAVHTIVSRSKEFGAQDWTIVLYALSRVPDSSLRPQLEEMVSRLLPALHGLPLPSVVLLAYSAGCMGPSHTGRCLVVRCMSVLASPQASQGGAQPAPTTRRSLQSRAGVRPKRTAAGGRVSGSTGAERQGGVAEGQEGADVVGGSDTRPLTLDALTPNELSALLWAAVRVGIRVLPTAFRAQFFSRTQPRLLPGSLVASYLWACGRLRMWPPLRWRHQMVAAAKASLGDMRARELAMCMAGMMWLRVFPNRQLLRHLADCFATHRDEMPDNLRQHAERALQVLTRRQELSVRLNSRQYGGLRRWLMAVWRGNELAVAAGKGVVQRRQRPEGYITRRSALRQGVERRLVRLLPEGTLGAVEKANE